MAANQNSNVSLIDLEQTAAVIAATSRANAEAAYHYVVAQNEAQQLEGLAIAVGTPQAQFDALAEDVYAEWINSLADDFVTRETAKAMADGWRAYNLAVAWRTRTNAREVANYYFTVNTAVLNADRALAEAAVEVFYAGLNRGYENTRNLANQTTLASLEISLAVGAKNYAMSMAAATKLWQIETLQKNSAAGSHFSENSANATLAQTTHLEDAKLGFQVLESTARQTYSGYTALAEANRSIDLATLAKNAATTAAGYQAAVDEAFALAEENYWIGETAAENIHRASTALADVTYWTAEESARVAAATDIDAALDLPWSDFLVAQATAHANWWSGMTDDYLDWIADRSAAEAAWQTNINAAHYIQAGLQSGAKYNLTINSAEAARIRDVALAGARFTYVDALLIPAKTYVDGIALVNRNYAVATATALRDYWLDTSPLTYETYNNKLDVALQNKRSSITSAEDGYEAAEAFALASRLMTATNARYGYATNVATAIKESEIANANALRDFRVAETGAFCRRAD